MHVTSSEFPAFNAILFFFVTGELPFSIVYYYDKLVAILQSSF
jgi:hypothetical protein